MVSTHGITLDGMAGKAVEIEVDLANGLPTTVIVGLADTTVSEARNRVRSAVANSGTTWPDQRVTINLAPSNLPKTGSHYDLAMAVAVFAAKGLLPSEELGRTVFLGELALDGRLRPVRGILPAVLAAAETGFSRVVVPEVNLPEAELVQGVEVIGARSLRHVVAILCGEPAPEEPPIAEPATDSSDGWASSRRLDHLDLADVVGQTDAAAAAVVAAAGGHHLAMTGPPGIGKTMIAQRLPSLLPDLEIEASIETSAVHSIGGVLPADAPLVVRPPFVDPHHSASAASIIGGGGRAIRPGAIALAHNGVLFLDEAPEFAVNVIDALRQPLESGRIVVSRASATAVFPARFQLVIAANPCPCGHAGGTTGECRCTPAMVRRYAERISGPIRDRIDIHRTLVAPRHTALVETPAASLDTRSARALVVSARARQAARWSSTSWTLNANAPGVELRTNWPPTENGRILLDRHVRNGSVSARAADRILRLAWTVTDLLARPQPDEAQVATAMALHNGNVLPAGFVNELKETA